MKISTIILLVSTFSLLLSACSTAPVTGRRQMNLVSEAEVAKMSMASFEQMKQQLPISRDPTYNEMLTNVGERISQQVFWDMPMAEWEFVVFAQPDVNAFAMPGGKVGVFEGLFQIVKTEAELASVVAHEIAHVTARHTHERISQQMILSAGGNALGIATAVTGAGIIGGSGGYINMSSAIMGLYGVGANNAAMSWDQGKEAEADHIGIMYMAKAGYDPNASITVMERMVEMEGARPTNYNSTHPSSLDRLTALHGYLDEAMKEYEEAKEFFY